MANYLVPRVPLIPQSQNMACWYASAQMLIRWRRDMTQSSEVGIIDPSESMPDVARFTANNGIQDAQILGLARRLGLEQVPPMSPTEEAVEGWLIRYGPLWVNGTTHIVVIAGVRNGQLYIHDPWPVGVGKTEWRSQKWYEGFIDAGTNSGVFMHCPRLPNWTLGGHKQQALYKVRGGDNLTTIADRFYGKGTRWPEIYAANKAAIGANPNFIRPGLELIIPIK